MINLLQNPDWQRRLLFLLLVAVCLVLFFPQVGMHYLWESDEARYAELGREMLESGSFSHWIIPRLNYVIYLEKPPLYYWLTALSFAAFGVNEIAARLVPAVFGTLSVLILFALGRGLWDDDRAGFWSGLVLATSLMFLALSRVILVDMVLCCGILLAVWGAWSLRAGRQWGLYAFWVGCAIGFLTKGVLGPGLAAMAVVLFGLLAGEWLLLRRLLWDWRGWALFLLLCLPWVVAAAILQKGFITYFFWDEQVGRLLTTQHQRFEPWWYYFLLVPGAFLPWTMLLPWCVGRTFPRAQWRQPEARSWLMSAVWFVGFFVFFTVSRSKMLHYALPMLPLALLVGRPLSGVMSWPKGATAPAGLRASITALATLCLLLGLGLVVFAGVSRNLQFQEVGALVFLGPLALALLGLGVYAVRSHAWAAAYAPWRCFCA